MIVAPDPQDTALTTDGTLTIGTMRNRPEFLRAASARRQGTGGFMVQARFRNDERDLVQVGFTASKKIGNAVMRNRAKRRLRELARTLLPKLGQAGWDYVLVARPGATVTRPYAQLLSDLEGALRQIHRSQAERVSQDTPPDNSSAK